MRVDWDDYPDARWFREQTSAQQKLFDEVPWHVDGDRKLLPVSRSVRKYSVHINKLPEKFLPCVFDQHLAVLSGAFEYQVMDLLGELGDDRYLCSNSDGDTFCLWSRALTASIDRGGVSVLTAIKRLGSVSGKFVPAITYGPVLVWKALRTEDFEMIAGALARDLVKSRGLAEVIRRDPAPFWAVWSLSDLPCIFYRSEPVGVGWYEGVFTSDPEPLCQTGWKREVLGRRVRLLKPGSKPFFQREVIYDTKTRRGIVLARLENYARRLKKSLSEVFDAEMEDLVFVNPVLETAFRDILRVDLPYTRWTKPFYEQDARRQKEDESRHPERLRIMQNMKRALDDLMGYINSGREPDWSGFGVEYDLGPDELAMLQGIFQNYRR